MQERASKPGAAVSVQASATHPVRRACSTPRRPTEGRFALPWYDSSVHVDVPPYNPAQQLAGCTSVITWYWSH